jgi:hypothetical protein
LHLRESTDGWDRDAPMRADASNSEAGGRAEPAVPDSKLRGFHLLLRNPNKILENDFRN